ncbi:MAG TPA: phosphotransferase family protein [Acidimicrobiales bacterium]|nr:phosphotransferase family protein [Acidimicrobiales bacterium]
MSLEQDAGSPDVVERAGAAGARPPLIVLDAVRCFLDAHGLGCGPLRASRIGAGGGSNFSFLLERGGERFVLRRPPRPPLPPSAHDVVREARLQMALEASGIRVQRIRAVCEDEALLGVPFYVSDYIEGVVLTDELPPGLAEARSRRRLGEDLVDALVEIHAVDASSPGLAPFVRPGSYAERQVRRFTQLWAINATRELPLVGAVAARLAASIPEALPSGVVHGDYRVGNLIVRPGAEQPVIAVLDWEMGAVGDPRADVGYLLATYSEPGGATSALGASPVTAAPGFPSRDELLERYRAQSGREVDPVEWFEALAMWKAAVFCEAIYGRYIRGELTSDDTRAARYEHIVPELAERASRRLDELGR